MKIFINNELENKEIRDLHELVNKCSSKPGPNNYKLLKEEKDIESFSSQIGAEDLDENDIKDFFVSFVNQPGPFQGLRRIFDENFCIYTGLTQGQIMSEKYSMADYRELKDIVNKRRQLILPKVPNVVIDILEMLKRSNKYLNEYFSSWSSKLSPTNTDAWEDLRQEPKK